MSINWLNNLFKSKKAFKQVNWKTDSSIYAFIANNLDEEGKLKDSAQDLPDEKHLDDKSVRFVAGLTDSMFGSFDDEKSQIQVDRLVVLIANIARHGDEKSKTEFYNIITSKDYIISIVDGFLEKMVVLSLKVDPYLFDFSKDLALKTAHRNSVKFGIAMLGVCQKKSIIPELKLIGVHDEFTVFSVVAIMNLSDNSMNELWELGKKINGWGKIQIVNRLAKMNLTPEIKDWLVIDGYKNSIMNEELAYTCAVTGDLNQKLHASSIDRKLFTAASDIISALINGGPAENISDYLDAAVAVESYIRHAKDQANDITGFIILNELRDFLVEIQHHIPDHSQNGWTQDITSNCLIDIAQILNGRDWSEAVWLSLKSADDVQYWDAKKAAGILKIDIREVVWQRLKDNPTKSISWFDMIKNVKPEQVDDVIQFAVQEIPLKELSTGPKDSLGFGPEYEKYQSLEYVTTFLENYPRKGEIIVITSLNCPVTRNRNMALKVLYKWGKDNWSEQIRSSLIKLNTIEPNHDTKKNIVRLLTDEALI